MTWGTGGDPPPQRYSRMLLLLCVAVLITGISALLIARAMRENSLRQWRLTSRSVAAAPFWLHAVPSHEEWIRLTMPPYIPKRT